MKGPSGKTNAQIARSFVQNVASKKSKKETKITMKDSEKLKSNKVLNEEVERPRTSTIQKGVAKNDHIFMETSEKNMGKLYLNL